MKVKCGHCEIDFCTPDFEFWDTGQMPILERTALAAEFDRLLSASRTKSELYYLLTLFGGVAPTRPVDFAVEVNRITQVLLIDRMTGVNTSTLKAHEAIFLLQTNLESKAHYAALRNIVSPLVGRPFRPTPWLNKNGLNEWGGKPGAVTVRTTPIVRNLITDLKTAGFADLANEFHETHAGLGSIIRNATAHATFLAPTEKTDGNWVFGGYDVGSGDSLITTEHILTQREFEAFVRRFFTVRLAFLEVCTRHQTALRTTTFDFAAENQMKPGQMLQCRFETGQLLVKQPGGPIF